MHCRFFETSQRKTRVFSSLAVEASDLAYSCVVPEDNSHLCAPGTCRVAEHRVYFAKAKLRGPEFCPWSGDVGFVANRVALRDMFLPAPLCFLLSASFHHCCVYSSVTDRV